MKRIGLLTCLLLVLTGCVCCSCQAEETSLPAMNREELFSKRDEDSTWNKEDAREITLQESGITLSEEGVYLLSGTLENGQILVNAPKEAKVQLVLNGVHVHHDTHAALYIKQADKVFITLAPGTENTLSAGETFVQIDENKVDAAVFSKEDVTFNGEGQLTILSPGGHGIAGKDEITITDGAYHITASGHGMDSKDSIAVSGGTFTLIAGKDGLHAEHSEDDTLGFLYIEEGSFSITAQGDGISASGAMEIAGGSFQLLCGGGSEQAPARQSGFDPGNFGRRGAPPDSRRMPIGPGEGEKQNGNPLQEQKSNAAEEAEISQKGLKAGGSLLLTGGTFILNSADDAIHSNATIQLDGGTYLLQTGDDGIHAEENLVINGGALTIPKGYEGLEGLHIRIHGGEITLTADDDGLNAAGGTDQSGFGGGFGRGDRFGGRGFGGMQAGSGSIVISGGRLSVTAYGDGIDANGSFRMDGGQVIVCGPTQGDTATLDYDTTAEINGGTFIGTGAAGRMAQIFSGGTQGQIAVQINKTSAGTAITLTDTEEFLLLSHTPALDYQAVILSAPTIEPGQPYTLQVGTSSGTFTAR